MGRSKHRVNLSVLLVLVYVVLAAGFAGASLRPVVLPERLTSIIALKSGHADSMDRVDSASRSGHHMDVMHMEHPVPQQAPEDSPDQNAQAEPGQSQLCDGCIDSIFTEKAMVGEERGKPRKHSLGSTAPEASQGQLQQQQQQQEALQQPQQSEGSPTHLAGSNPGLRGVSHPSASKVKGDSKVASIGAKHRLLHQHGEPLHASSTHGVAAGVPRGGRVSGDRGGRHRNATSSHRHSTTAGSVTGQHAGVTSQPDAWGHTIHKSEGGAPGVGSVGAKTASGGGVAVTGGVTPGGHSGGHMASEGASTEALRQADLPSSSATPISAHTPVVDPGVPQPRLPPTVLEPPFMTWAWVGHKLVCVVCV